MACLQHFNHKEQVWSGYGMMEISKRVNVQANDHGMFAALQSQRSNMEWIFISKQVNIQVSDHGMFTAL